MSDRILKEGGPFRIRKVSKDEYTLSVDMPIDEDERIARACPEHSCLPGYFKVKPGTGITEHHDQAFCPYCRSSDDPSAFMTPEQIRYAEDVLAREVHKGINRMLKDALGLGVAGRKKIGDDFFSIEMSYKPTSLPHVIQPLEDILKRDVICPYCGLDHSVYGLATWCADCGRDIFMTHVKAEFKVVRMMLKDNNQRKKKFGVRVAAKDVENALEDTVSIFEATLRYLVKRHLINKSIPRDDIDVMFRRNVGNKFQNIVYAAETAKELTGEDLLKGLTKKQIGFLGMTFQKRHPITHNLGIVDKKYLERVRSGEIAGKEILVTVDEVRKAITLSFKVLNSYHKRLSIGRH